MAFYGDIQKIQIFSEDIRRGITYRLTKKKRTDALRMLYLLEEKVAEMKRHLSTADQAMLELQLYSPNNQWAKDYISSRIRRRFE